MAVAFKFLFVLWIASYCSAESFAPQSSVNHAFLMDEIEILVNSDLKTLTSGLEGKQFFPRDDCRRLLSEFSEAISNYTHCGIFYARPVNLCLQCKHTFLRVKEKFREMENFFQDGISCKEVLTKQDHLDIVTSVYNVVIGANGIWEMGNCNNCYNKSDTSNSMAEEAKVYVKLLQETWNCFNSYANLSDILTRHDGQGRRQGSSNEFAALCGNCSESYFNTRKYFWESLVPSTLGADYGSVCIDLKDAFNFTGYIWGVEFGCNSELNMGGFWFLILIPFGVLIAITYGVPTFFIPWYYGSRHKVLTLLAIPDHYDKAFESYSEDVSNLRDFVDTAQEDGEELLSIEEEEKRILKRRLYRLIRRLQEQKSKKNTEKCQKVEKELFEVFTELSKGFDESDDDTAESDRDDNEDGGLVDEDTGHSTVQSLRFRRTRQRGQSINPPNVDWSEFKAYLDGDDLQREPNHVEEQTEEEVQEIEV